MSEANGIVRLSDTVTIIHGDCRDIIPTLRGVDAVVTDPPYGIGYQHSGGGKLGVLTNKEAILHDDEPFDPTHLLMFEQRNSSTGGAGGRMPIVIWGANHFAHKLPPATWLVWDKACGMGPHSSFVDAEFAWTTRKTPRCVFHHLWLGLLRAGEGATSKTRRSHPSQKPVELMLWCLETCRIGLGKTVLDPYMGSGTTGIACIRTGRKFIGIEKDAVHFEIARERLENELRQGLLPLTHNAEREALT